MAKLRQGRPSAQQSADLTGRLVEVATGLFLRDGYEATAMEAVAAAADVPKTTLYKRFADKGALARAVVDKQVDSWSALTSTQTATLPPDLRSRMVYHVALVLAWSTKPEVCAVTKLAAAASSEDKATGPTFVGYRSMIDFLAGEIATFGPSAGILAADPQRVADAIMALVAGWSQTRAFGESIAIEVAMSDASFLVSVLMDGQKVW